MGIKGGVSVAVVDYHVFSVAVSGYVVFLGGNYNAALGRVYIGSVYAAARYVDCVVVAVSPRVVSELGGYHMKFCIHRPKPFALLIYLTAVLLSQHYFPLYLFLIFLDFFLVGGFFVFKLTLFVLEIAYYR